MKNKLIIFDTTLRDGEQSPGASMTQSEKVRIALALEKMRVDVIEAGFAFASAGDFNSVQKVANTIKDSRVCSLARALDKDIDRAAEALKGANAARIHTFIATSDIHMQKKLHMTKDEVLAQATRAVSRARNLCDDVEFSPEDAGRSDIDFLCRIIEHTINAGARTINIPDTVGYSTPSEFGNKIAELIARIPNSDKAIFSSHCHNDLGLAVANSLSAVLAGARQVECTINGLGERAGNAALEEIVMAIKTRENFYPCGIGIDTKHILAASKTVSAITGFVVQPNKSIVGANAFAHESGIHQDGVLKYRETYEIMRAEDVGWNTNKLILGKLSGRNAFKSKLQVLNIKISADKFEKAFIKFKELADKKQQIFDEDIQLLVLDNINDSNIVKFDKLSVTIDDKGAKANISLKINNIKKTSSATTGGAVDATFSAINKLLDLKIPLELYSVNNVTSGTDSLGVVNVRVEHNGGLISASGTDVDIVKASAKAYINVINRVLLNIKKPHPQL